MAALCLLLGPAQPAEAGMDSHLEKKAALGAAPEFVNVILQTDGLPTAADFALAQAYGGEVGRKFSVIHGFAARVPSPALKGLAHNPRFTSVSFDAPMRAFYDMNPAAISVGATQVRQDYGYTGKGIGVAVPDSGVVSNHADLRSPAVSAVISWNDYVNPSNKSIYDPYGHGSHVVGLIAGNGSLVGRFAGVAPGASIHALRVLDGTGMGTVSNVLASLDWVNSTATFMNIRVVNLSLGHPVYESYSTDPLCLAIKTLAEKGIVVVCAAGNYGRDPSTGQPRYGSITSPGNSPYALTVGAVNPLGTEARGDDVMAGFSSRGPTLIDLVVKPDVVAPGVWMASLFSAGSYVGTNYPDLKLETTLFGLGLGNDDYMLLSGTSMAAPVVSGIVALMLEANPSLTPNLVKGILQYTAETMPQYDVWTQGAGYVNALGAVQAAASITSTPLSYADGTLWLKPGSAPFTGSSTINGQSIFWGNTMVWGSNVFWGGYPIQYNFTGLWSQAIMWGGTPVEMLYTTYLQPAGVQASAVFWTDYTALDASAVLWWSPTTVSDIVYGEGVTWGDHPKK